MENQRANLIQKVVFAATEVGIAVAQEVAEASLKQKPGMLLKEFTKVLDTYVQKQKEQEKIGLRKLEYL